MQWLCHVTRYLCKPCRNTPIPFILLTVIVLCQLPLMVNHSNGLIDAGVIANTRMEPETDVHRDNDASSVITTPIPSNTDSWAIMTAVGLDQASTTGTPTSTNMNEEENPIVADAVATAQDTPASPTPSNDRRNTWPWNMWPDLLHLLPSTINYIDTFP